jgi:hypothetical protein
VAPFYFARTAAVSMTTVGAALLFTILHLLCWLWLESRGLVNQPITRYLIAYQVF